MNKITASIVIYNENKETLSKVINSFLAIDGEKELIIVDNSSEDYMKEFCKKFDNIKYIFSSGNIGFGSGHNLAFKNKTISSDIHLILNPDIYFDGIEITDFIKYLYENKSISLAVPRVYFPDGEVQNTIRNIPTPLTLLKRRLNIKGIFDNFIKKDEFDGVIFDSVTEIPFAHGCFFAFQTSVFEKIEGFDERFFMYMEDIDIFIRAKVYGKTVVIPDYKIFHEYRKGSSKNIKLLKWHLESAFKFFIKKY
jgi:GT2 family glycosyltransferase